MAATAAKKSTDGEWTQQCVGAPNQGPQAALLACPIFDIFYGGAKGGGKSYGLLLAWLIHAQKSKRARGIVFRRTYSELEELIEISNGLFPLLRAKWNGSTHSWRMANGAGIKFRYLKKPGDHNAYQGHSYTFMGRDELTHWPNADELDKVQATVRSAVPGLRPEVKSTGNPGGPGHNWVKARYISPHPLGWRSFSAPEGGFRRIYIPSKLHDNPPLLKNDPGYEQRLDASGPAWLVKAWKEGNWDVAAGGMFDDVWDPDVHVMRGFYIPNGWRLSRAFDWGSSKPYSVGYWAESDGTPAEVAPGKIRTFPPGTMIRFGEVYGCTGVPNEGVREKSTTIANRCKRYEMLLAVTTLKMTGNNIAAGPADTAIFDEDEEDSIAKRMATVGITWTRANKGPGSRITGWNAIRDRLIASCEEHMEEPGLFVFETCTDWIRTVPSLPRDLTNPDDVDTDAEDHCGDETRYRLITPTYEIHERRLLGL